MKDNSRQNNRNPGEKDVLKNCSTCEFNFGDICAGYGARKDNGEATYGMPIKEAEIMFPEGCNDYGISLDAFIDANG